MLQLSLSCTVPMKTMVVCVYHLRCGIYCANLEACGEDKSPGGATKIVRSMQTKSPGGAATIVKSMQKESPSAAAMIVRSMQSEKSKCSCNDS